MFRDTRLPVSPDQTRESHFTPIQRRRSAPRRRLSRTAASDLLNVSAYVANDPINASDPLGLECTVPPGSVLVCGSRPNDPIGGAGSEGSGPTPGANPGNVGGLQSGDPIEVVGKRLKRTVSGLWSDFIKGLRTTVCKAPAISAGGGADLYAGAGGSVGGGLNLDFAKGRFGISGYSAVGLGLGADAGPNIGLGPSGGGIVSANLAAGAGFAVPTPIPGTNLGLSGNYNLLGTDPGPSGGGIGRVGTPLGYANIGANIGLSTPSLYSCG